MEDLIRIVAERAGITTEQSACAIAAMVNLLSARLPSPVVGQIRAILDGERVTATAIQSEHRTFQP